ncbi:MAG: ATP synthase F1 subunit gamma [Ignavibacteriae bacterium]|nr:ATP synthase F1 subunit gamma [Ignavibacteriota bacterium]
MANLREIRRRIAGIRSTSKITQAMKLVAAAKLRRAQDSIISARPYARHLRGLMKHMLARVDRASLPLWFEGRDDAAVLIVVVTADRGLCGAFNTNVIKAAVDRIERVYADKHAEGKVRLVCVGRRGYQFFVKRDIEVVGKHLGIVNAPDHAAAKVIIDEILATYMSGEIGTVEVIYNEFKSIIQQRLQVETLLPIPAEEVPAVEAHGHTFHSFVDYIYEPSEQALMEFLIPKQLNFQMLRVLLESNAAEQGARMTAMDAATSNAKDLINRLQLEYNSARQASITKEILEIVGGAEALRKSD